MLLFLTGDRACLLLSTPPLKGTKDQIPSHVHRREKSSLKPFVKNYGSAFDARAFRTQQHLHSASPIKPRSEGVRIAGTKLPPACTTGTLMRSAKWKAAEVAAAQLVSQTGWYTAPQIVPIDSQKA